ncbi:uncharacterized protein LOC121241729 [Juglans microcarpa x Juglans regia]|uniref:uncharacterized protein LOC121241729 n=1 Tax=Juglans microcarpa x Juglans regia TaxID=2249226 RepID=UPI001B7EB742|nr:uncharacterized protein LOC121241729 [Juglans microcarpa x Juglans regia]XP_040995556.1 uncharacterized protein LOC121241729 [Juglans microcarpa x Juglans regia]
MDNQRNPLVSWVCKGKTMEELRTALLYTSLELEQTRLAVQEEIRKRDEELVHFKDLLREAIRERDEAQEKCRLLLEKILLQQHPTAPLSGNSSIEDEPRIRGIDSNNGFSSSDCEGSIVSSSPVVDPIPQSFPQATVEQLLVPEKPLPEKGKLLEAVMNAGPLLQTLLLAGPLPQWRHPPPPLESFEIPPVTIPSPPHPALFPQDSITNILRCNSTSTSCGINRKRVLCEGSDSPTETKYQRLAIQ